MARTGRDLLRSGFSHALVSYRGIARDGIGPEVVSSALEVLRVLEARLEDVRHQASVVGAVAFPYLLSWTGGPKTFFYVGAMLNVGAIMLWLLARSERKIDFHR